MTAQLNQVHLRPSRNLLQKNPRLKSFSDVRGSPNTNTDCSGTTRKDSDKEMR